MLIKTDPQIITGYLEDASGFTQGAAERLVIPESAMELAEYLQSASRHHEPVTLVGGRTGVTAGCIPLRGTLLSLERLNFMAEIKTTPQGNSLWLGSAVRLSEIKALAKQAGLIYGPDPTEPTGTIGGNVATNASGGQGFKYGTTRQHILGLQIALTRGELLTLERGQILAQGDRIKLPLPSGMVLDFSRPQLPPLQVAKNAAGYFSRPNMDVLDLFIGMEGTLGVITGIQVKLMPAPEGLFSLALFFPSGQAARECSRTLQFAAPNPASPDIPSPTALEFMDQHALALLRPAFPNIPSTAQAVLLVEQEYTAINEEAELIRWMDFIKSCQLDQKHIWFAQDQASRLRLRELRHALPETINTLVRQRGFPKVGTDLAVPAEAFSTLFESYYQHLSPSGLDFLIFGHIGEGHLHVNVLPKTQAEFLQAKQIYFELAQTAISLGGTVSAEHGIGKIKHEFLKMMVGEAGLREMARIKGIFDPAMILNRGNIFPESYLAEG